MNKRELQQKLDAHTDKSGNCWMWTRSRGTYGYGQMWDGHTIRGTHRIAWELANDSEIPEGMVIRHACDNPPCVRPEHLSLGTHKENSLDWVERGSAPAYQRAGIARPYFKGTLSERVDHYTDKSGDCWMWKGGTFGNGYGYLKVKGTSCLAHRVSYELHKGEIPEGMVVRHTCDVPLCINPSHLLLGTQSDNMRDKVLRGRTSTRPVHVYLGESHPSAKLTESDVREIRVKHASGETQTALGHEYGVSSRQIGYIVHRKKWKHVV